MSNSVCNSESAGLACLAARGDGRGSNNDLRSRMDRAMTLAKDGRSDEAAQELREVIRQAPGHAAAHHNLAVVLVEQGKTEEAVRSFRRALELRPDYGDAHCNLGGLLARLGRRQEAVAHLHQAIRLHPDNAGSNWTDPPRGRS